MSTILFFCEVLIKSVCTVVPEAVVQIRALGCAADAVRVTWLAPASAPRLTHYTLYTRELGKYACLIYFTPFRIILSLNFGIALNYSYI